MVSDWFQTTLKLTFFLKESSSESYGGWKLLQICPDDLFFYIRTLQGHPEASSVGFRGV